MKSNNNAGQSKYTFPVPFVLHDTHTHTHNSHVHTLLERPRCYARIQNKLLSFHCSFSRHLSTFRALRASFFLSGLQGLVNPVVHLAQLFDLDLSIMIFPFSKMILILNDTAHCWENETSVAASPFRMSP